MGPNISLKTSIPPAPSLESAPVQTPGGTRLKLKFGGSQVNTPAVEQPSALPTSAKKSGKKRAANEELASPAAKRIASEANERRRSSLKINVSAPRKNAAPTDSAETPGPRLKLQKRKSSNNALIKSLRVKGKVPDRVPGNAYDSEDDDRERDPAVEQQLILRMQPGEDCDFLRQAIMDRTIGTPVQDGGADVTFRFLDRDLRRAIIGIRKNQYAAVLVDMPCIIETMKSWDKRGWWKVADISQMLLVLGRVDNEDEARTMPLPARAINEKTMAYAHGLTPPMRSVRRHRFRKRLSYKDNANVEDEVKRLLDEDDRTVQAGGEASFDILNRDLAGRSPGATYYEDDEPINTIEGQDYESGDELDLDDFEAGFGAAGQQITSATIVDSPVMLGEARLPASSETPVATPAVALSPAAADTAGEESSDEDDDDDDDDDEEPELDAIDEDAQQKALERNQQNQELDDIANEIKIQQQKLDAMNNLLLQKRQREKIQSLQADLAMKRQAFGLDDDDDEE